MSRVRPLVLGIETSCDETAAAVVEDGRIVRSDVVATQHDLHEAYAGVVPEIAGRAHVERILPVIERALADAGVAAPELDAVAVGHRPGLAGSLLVGVSAAKALAWTLRIPFIGVDHVAAHLHAARLHDPRGDGGAVAPPPIELPAIGLVVSGGHTTLYAVAAAPGGGETTDRLGGTIDDAVGEAFDKVAAMLGLPLPGGPSVEALAADGDEHALDLPVARLPSPLDFSFSGLKTAVLYAVRGRPAHPSRPGRGGAPTVERPADAAASFQRAAIRALVRGTAAALDAVPEARSIVVGGGVSANRALRTALAALAEDRGVRLRVPPLRWCTDNAAMIAGLAALRVRAGEADGLDLPVHTTSAFGRFPTPEDAA